MWLVILSSFVLLFCELEDQNVVKVEEVTTLCCVANLERQITRQVSRLAGVTPIYTSPGVRIMIFLVFWQNVTFVWN